MKCKICNKEIYVTVENWNKLETYKKTQNVAVFYFHDLCYSDLISGKVAIKHMVNIIRKQIPEEMRA